MISIPLDDNKKLTVQDYRDRLYNEVTGANIMLIFATSRAAWMLCCLNAKVPRRSCGARRSSGAVVSLVTVRRTMDTARYLGP